MKITKYFILNNKKIPYYFEEKEVRYFTLKLDNNNNIIFVSPINALEKQKEHFLNNNFAKIYSKSLKRNSLSDSINFEENYFYCFGNKINIDYDIKTNLLKINDKVLSVSANQIINQINLFKISLLEEYIKQKQFELEIEYGMKHSKVLVKNKERSWATNYVLKNKIIYSANLASFSKTTINYVIVHELCHNVFQDHSKEYWNLVKEKFPNYKIEIQKLKKFIFS